MAYKLGNEITREECGDADGEDGERGGECSIKECVDSSKNENVHEVYAVAKVGDVAYDARWLTTMRE